MTHNVKDPPLSDWGYLSDSVKLAGTMSEVSIPVSKLKPAPYSKAATNNVTWDASKKLAFGFQIKAENSKEAEVYIDDIAFAGMKYSDIITQAAGVKQAFNILPSYSIATISVNNRAFLYTVNQAQKISISLFNVKGSAIDFLFSGNVFGLHLGIAVQALNVIGDIAVGEMEDIPFYFSGFSVQD